MRKASIHDAGRIAASATAAARWYYSGSRVEEDRIAGIVRECLSGGKHYCMVGGGTIVCHVTPNPYGQKQIATVLFWEGSPALVKAMVRWFLSRPGIVGIHMPISPSMRVGSFLWRLG